MNETIASSKKNISGRQEFVSRVLEDGVEERPNFEDWVVTVFITMFLVSVVIQMKKPAEIEVNLVFLITDETFSQPRRGSVDQ